MRQKFKYLLCSAIFLIALPAQSATLTFDFTGRLVVVDPSDNVLLNDVNGLTQSYTPIEASLTFDTNTGLGASALSITMNTPFFGSIATFHDITMARVGDTNIIEGGMLIDWNTPNMPLHIEWDATGLFNAINYESGLQVGDVLSGTDLYHDINGNGVQDAGEYLTDIGSATPYSDGLQSSVDPAFQSLQGPAPLAATSNSLGLIGGPFSGFRGLVDIGSGNSIHVTSVSYVPVPAAVWLFGSGLLGLIGVARRKKS